MYWAAILFFLRGCSSKCLFTDIPKVLLAFRDRLNLCTHTINFFPALAVAYKRLCVFGAMTYFARAVLLQYKNVYRIAIIYIFFLARLQLIYAYLRIYPHSLACIPRSLKIMYAHNQFFFPHFRLPIYVCVCAWSHMLVRTCCLIPVRMYRTAILFLGAAVLGDAYYGYTQSFVCIPRTIKIMHAHSRFVVSYGSMCTHIGPDLYDVVLPLKLAYIDIALVFRNYW